MSPIHDADWDGKCGGAQTRCKTVVSTRRHDLSTRCGLDVSSVAAHMRHVLDHYTSFLAGLENGSINYDHCLRLRSSRSIAAPRWRQSVKRWTGCPTSLTGIARRLYKFAQNAVARMWFRRLIENSISSSPTPCSTTRSWDCYVGCRVLLRLISGSRPRHCDTAKRSNWPKHLERRGRSASLTQVRQCVAASSPNPSSSTRASDRAIASLLGRTSYWGEHRLAPAPQVGLECTLQNRTPIESISRCGLPDRYKIVQNRTPIESILRCGLPD